MRILFLGYESCRVLDFLRARADVFQTSKRLKDRYAADFDLIVSFGYRFILRPELLSICERPPINLHIAFLPHNRGADPNFWSFHDDTPKGVSIHLMDEGIDTGPIIYQRRVDFASYEDDLAKTYSRLYEEVQDLFIENWERIVNEDYTPMPQAGIGSYHIVGAMPELPHGWHTKTGNLGRAEG